MNGGTSPLDKVIDLERAAKKRLAQTFFNYSGIIVSAFLMFVVALVVTTDIQFELGNLANLGMDFFLLLFCSYAAYTLCGDTGQRREVFPAKASGIGRSSLSSMPEQELKKAWPLSVLISTTDMPFGFLILASGESPQKSPIVISEQRSFLENEQLWQLSRRVRLREKQR